MLSMEMKSMFNFPQISEEQQHYPDCDIKAQHDPFIQSHACICIHAQVCRLSHQFKGHNFAEGEKTYQRWGEKISTIHNDSVQRVERADI